MCPRSKTAGLPPTYLRLELAYAGILSVRLRNDKTPPRNGDGFYFTSPVFSGGTPRRAAFLHHSPIALPPFCSERLLGQCVESLVGRVG